MFEIDPGLRPTVSVNPAVFIRSAFEGVPIAPLIQARLDALGSEGDAARLLELGSLFQLTGDRDNALLCQNAALEICRLYRHEASATPALRLLALVTAGDLMTNTPFELMVENLDVEITKLYLDAATPLPAAVPDHDLAIMAISESDQTRELLQQLAAIEGRWPRPIINGASGVLNLARDRLYMILADAPGVTIPPTLRIPREELAQAIHALAPERGGYPIIIRPVGSHAGKALERIDDAARLAAYLDEEPAALFYISPFVDYAGADGLYRKYRIAFFDGRPYLAHMAVSEHWMVHYLNAGMEGSAVKRAEEQRTMETFDEDFVARNKAGMESLARLIGLDYFAVDCGESPDGELLIFEADVAMIVHDLDPEALYPYKKRQMRKVFDAFDRFLQAKRGAAG